MRGSTSFFFWCLFSYGNAYRFLALLPWPGKSHHMVFQPYLEALAKRGHEMTVITPFPVNKSIPSYTEVSVEEIYDKDRQERVRLDRYDRFFAENRSGLAYLLRFYVNFLPQKDLALEICNRFVEWPSVQFLFDETLHYDAVILSQFNSDCMFGIANRIKAPMISLLAHRFVPWSADRTGSPEIPSYTPTSGLPFGSKMNFWQRFINTFGLAGRKLWFENIIQDQEQIILEKKFGHKIPDLKYLTRNISLTITYTHHSFTGIIPHPPGVIEANGWHLKKVLDSLNQDVEKFLNDSKDGVIVFSFGSLLKSSTMTVEKQQIFLKVFSKFPQRIVWKWEGEPIKEAGSNIKFVKWIQQYELLSHSKVVAFIGHGGLLGMTEAVATAKPMLVIPFFGDQPTNAALAEEAGLAVALEYYDITEETLTAALEKVLSKGMRESAKRLSRVWHDRAMDPMDEAIYYTERVARLGFDAQMLPASRHMPFYQTAMLDVIAMAAAIVFLVVYINYKLVKMFLKFLVYLCFKRNNSKEKLN